MNIPSETISKSILPFIAVLCLAGCGTVHFAAPTPPVKESPPATPPTSIIEVPLSVSMAKLQTSLHGALPKSIGEAEFNHNINGGADHDRGLSLGYGVERSAPALTSMGSRISANAEIAYWVSARGRPTRYLGIPGPLVYGSCGKNEPLRKLDVQMSTGLSISQDWRTSLSTTVDSVAAQNRCRVVLPFIDLTDEIVRLFREELTRQAASIDSSLGQQIALRETAESIWNTAAKPIPVGESAWLLIKPNRVSASPVTFDSAGLHWSMKLEAYPQVVLGTPPNDPPAALPLLTPTIPGNMFYVAMPVSAQYEFIETQLDHTLGIKQGNLRYPSGQDRQVSVKDLRLYAYGDKAVVRAVIVGSYGILRNFELVGYLIGTPHFDSERNVLSFPDLDFTIDTGNLLLKAADWLKHDEIRDDLRRRLTVDITEPAKNARTTLERTLNQRIGAVALTGKINDLRLTSVKTDPGANSFRADTILQGTLSATIP